jgi:hypothetical protein
MNSRSAYRRLRACALGVAAAAVIAPSGAGAATTVGSTFNPTPCGANTLLLQTSSAANSYAVPSAGVLTSWSFQASGTPPDLKLIVARPTNDPTQFQVVGKSEIMTPTASMLTTDTDVSIPVLAGDILGFRLSTSGDCISSNGQTGYEMRGLTSAEPALNAFVTVGTGDDRKLDISATLEPDADDDGLGDETQDLDDDADGVADLSDNCASVANADQADVDGDAEGDACDTDDDGDGLADASDNCAGVVNADQANLDGDALGDVCDLDDDGDGVVDASDNCASVANAGQGNLDGDAQGNACDADDDGDGAADGTDNCPENANADQGNADGDAQGDACDQTPAPSSTPDTTKPVISVLRMSSSAFQAAGSGPAFTATVGTTASFALSEAGTVRFTVQRKTKGRRVAGGCKRQTQANRARKPCTRWVAVKGSFSIPAEQGETGFTFRGRIGVKKLKPGSYRLNGRATDAAGNKSATRRATFRIVR